jgi:hypothetical protein
MGNIGDVLDPLGLYDDPVTETTSKISFPDPTEEETLLQDKFLNLFTTPNMRAIKNLCPKLGDMSQYDKSLGGWQCDNLKPYVPGGIVTKDDWEAILENEKESAPLDIEQTLADYLGREEEIGGRLETLMADWDDFVDRYGGEAGNIYQELQQDYQSMPDISLRIPTGKGTTGDFSLPTPKLEQAAADRATSLMDILGSGSELESKGMLGQADSINRYQDYNVGSLYPVQLGQNLLSNLQNVRIGQPTTTGTVPAESGLDKLIGIAGIVSSIYGAG